MIGTTAGRPQWAERPNFAAADWSHSLRCHAASCSSTRAPGRARPDPPRSSAKRRERRGIEARVLAARATTPPSSHAGPRPTCSACRGRRRVGRDASPRSRSSATCRSSASRSGRATTSPATSGSTGTIRSRALDAFGGEERRVDVGRVGERRFLNNVSLGVYASLVHRRERHRRRREALARAPRALAEPGAGAAGVWAQLDGEPVRARVVLVANNAYELEPLLVGERERLDEGRLHLYSGRGWLRATGASEARRAFAIDARRDGSRRRSTASRRTLETPVELAIEPRRATRLAAARARSTSTSGTFSKASSSARGQLVRREPAEVVDVVRGLRLAGQRARRPVEVQRRLGASSPRRSGPSRRRGSRPARPRARSPRAARARRPSSGCSPSSRKPPGMSQRPRSGSCARRASSTRPCVVLDERAGRRLRARVGDEAAGRAFDPRLVAAQLLAAARTPPPARELTHGGNNRASAPLRPRHRHRALARRAARGAFRREAERDRASHAARGGAARAAGSCAKATGASASTSCSPGLLHRQPGGSRPTAGAAAGRLLRRGRRWR